jgi:glycosyltransferase involved in cell wall biosynthesis
VLTDSETTHGDAIRVLILFSTGDIGGAERSLTRMVLACKDAGIAYRLATVGSGGTWSSWLATQQVESTCFGIFGGGKSSLQGIVDYLRFCRRHRPDIIYAVGLRAACVARMCKALMHPVKVVHGIRSTYPRGSQLATAFRRSERLLYPLTSAYIANSRQGGVDLLTLVKGITQSSMAVVYNGVTIPEVVSIAEARDLTIAVVANISGYKGHEAFLEVVDLVRRAIPAVSVLFIGRNDSGPSLESAIHKRGLTSTVRLLGYHPHPEELVRHSRVVALPSPQIEGCPTAVLEAMAMGVPVVAYQLGGLKEVIQSGATGILIERGDTEAFAAALIELLQDADANDRLGRAARLAIRAQFTIEGCATAHARQWRALLGNQRQSCLVP